MTGSATVPYGSPAKTRHKSPSYFDGSYVRLKSGRIVARKSTMAKQHMHHLTRKLSWSAEKPSQAGWYWRRGTYRDPSPIIVEVDEAGDFQWPDGSFDDVKVTGGEWAGPLDPPEDQEV